MYRPIKNLCNSIVLWWVKLKFGVLYKVMVSTSDSLSTLHISFMWVFSREWILDLEDHTAVLFSPMASSMLSLSYFYMDLTRDFGVFEFYSTFNKWYQSNLLVICGNICFCEICFLYFINFSPLKFISFNFFEFLGDQKICFEFLWLSSMCSQPEL